MPASSKSSRQSPQNLFDEYTLNLIVDETSGISNIPDDAMMLIPGPNEAAGTDDSISYKIDLPFTFSFDQQQFNSIYVSTNGWLSLVEKNDFAINGWTHTDLLTGAHWLNESIRTDITANHVLLAPWFDDLRNVANKLTTEDTDGSGLSYLEFLPAKLTTDQAQKLKYGLSRPPPGYSPTEAGVKYFFDQNSQFGKRFIIRWTSFSDYAWANSIIKFECVLYENGRIEFRYTPKLQMDFRATGLIGRESATCGIFGRINSPPRVGGSPGGSRFRDFSIELGKFTSRLRHPKGGARFDPSFIDPTPWLDDPTYYVSSLTPQLDWPGQETFGATIVFQPPHKRRKILPRALLRALDIDSSYPIQYRTGDSTRWTSRRLTNLFDDRRSIVWRDNITTTVNYPTKLPLGVGGNRHESEAASDLYEGGFALPGSTFGIFDALSIGLDSSVASRNRVPAYNESNIQNFVLSNNDNFSKVGSPTNKFDNLSQPLKDKTQISITLPVYTSMKFLETTSSISYYNVKDKTFYVKGAFVGKDSIGIVTASHTPQLSNVWQGDISRYAFPEDYRGFGPTGDLIVSGSDNDAFSKQSSRYIGILLDDGKFNDAIQANYPNSICLYEGQRWVSGEWGGSPQIVGNLKFSAADGFRADDTELIEIPINHPFLIEKAIIEIPIEAGPGWFKDKTKMFQPMTTYVDNLNDPFIDFGGPAVTCALFHQFNHGPDTRRSLILSGVFTHNFDALTTVKTETFNETPLDSVNYCQIYVEGFESYAGPPTAYVNSPEEDPDLSFFTGTIQLKTTAAVSNGALISHRKDANASGIPGSADANRDAARNFLKTKFLKAKSKATDSPAPFGYSKYGSIFRIQTITNLGRSQTGFEASGRSIFGKELIAAPAPTVVPNKLYMDPIPSEIESVIAAKNRFFITQGHSVLSTSESPYLIFPGEKLIFSISKTRPCTYVTPDESPDGSLSMNGSSHDIKIPSGTQVKITLYGSLLRESREFHDTLNQNICSNVVHDVIGSDYVLDQFEISDRFSLVNSFNDAFMTGSLVKQKQVSERKNPTDYFEIDDRRKVFSITSATRYNGDQVAPRSLTSWFLTSSIISAADRMTQQYEVAGIIRTISHIDSNEFYYDSFTPAISDCIARNGVSLVTDTEDTVYSSFNPVWVMNCQRYPSYISDNRWTWSYPFESHYSGIKRERISNSQILTAKIRVDLSGYASILTGTVRYISNSGLRICGGGYMEGDIPPVYDTYYNREVVWQDHKTIGDDDWYYHPTQNRRPTAMTDKDLAKVVFGFGDLNNFTGPIGTKRTDYHHLPTGSLTVGGANNLPTYRKRLGPYYKTANVPFPGVMKPDIRGWKYGLISGVPIQTKCQWRRSRFGQFRDMLEQRPYTRTLVGVNSAPNEGVVTVTFIEPSTGRYTNPLNTWSSNVDTFASSSLPYFDGESRNRPPINIKSLNQTTVTFGSDRNDNITI